MVTLDPAGYDDPAGAFVGCAVCPHRYHRACWARAGACVRPRCGSAACAPACVPPPAPLRGDVECVYPLIGVPNNALADTPLGVSCGVVFDAHPQAVEVRNNTAAAVRLPLVLGPLWAPLVPDPAGLYDPATGHLGAGEAVRFRVAFDPVRPPFVQRRVPLGAGQEVELRTDTDPHRNAVAVGAVCLLLVAHALLFVVSAATGLSLWWAAVPAALAAALAVYLSPGGVIAAVAFLSAGARRAVAGLYERVLAPDAHGWGWRPGLAVAIGLLALPAARLLIGVLVYGAEWVAGVESGVLRACAACAVLLLYATAVLAVWSPWINDYDIDLVPMARWLGRTLARWVRFVVGWGWWLAAAGVNRLRGRTPPPTGGRP